MSLSVSSEGTIDSLTMFDSSPTKREEQTEKPQHRQLSSNKLLLDSQSTLNGDVVYGEIKTSEGVFNIKNESVNTENPNGSKEATTSSHSYHHRTHSLSEKFSDANISGPKKGSTVKFKQVNHERRDDDVAIKTESYPCQQLTSNLARKQGGEDDSCSQELPSSGRKHRRMYSGGVSNPTTAHRRINSRGTAAFIDRLGYDDKPIDDSPIPIGHHFPSYDSWQRSNAMDRPRSTSPRPSPKDYSQGDFLRPSHGRDDSYIDNFFPPGRQRAAAYITKADFDTSGPHPDDGAFLLHSMRRSPPVHRPSSDYVDNYNTAYSYRRQSSQDPPYQPPLPSSSYTKYPGYNMPHRPQHTHEGNAHQPPNSIGMHHHSSSSHPPKQQYPLKYDEFSPLPTFSGNPTELGSAPSSSSNPWDDKEWKGFDYPVEVPGYNTQHTKHYPLPRKPQSSSVSSQHYPIQESNHRQSYPPHSSYSHRNTSTVAARAAEAASRAASLLQHPLANEAVPQRPRPNRDVSISSIDTKIETDEPLFQKDGASSNARNYPPRPLSNQPPYRTSPQLFQEALKGNGFLESPLSMGYSPCNEVNVESLVYSLVNPNPYVSSTVQQQHQFDDQTIPHHRKTESSVIYQSFVEDLNHKTKQTEEAPNRQRTNSTGSLVFDDNSLHGEQFISGSTSSFSPSVPPVSEFKSNGKHGTKTTTVKNAQSKGGKKDKTSTKSSTSSKSEPSSTSTGRNIDGKVSKRVRRKCTHDGCTNRVVQGGVCIQHGAKRKICGYEGCTKHVKKAGMCSTHGPARKRCEFEGCGKVAVQGGRCIAHGAKKRLCSFENCEKQAILSGMCKKHHDQSQANSESFGQYSANQCCMAVGNNGFKENEGNSPIDNGGSSVTPSSQHRRGLSIFQDMAAVNTIIGSTERNDVNSSYSTTSASSPESRQAPSLHNRGLSIFADEEIMGKIVDKKLDL